MQQVSDSLARAVNPTNSPQERRDTSTPAQASPSTHETIGSLRHSASSSFTPGNAVSLLASQIPEFAGDTDDNVQRWIQRVEIVARAHKANDDVILLAATSKLTKSAKDWFDIQSGSVLVSWTACREALIGTFDRKIRFYVIMKKVEARRWIPHKESFQKYAIEKQALIH